MQRKTILVLGTARAGTSLACGVVDCLGVQMLSAEPKPHQLRHNPKGMYELPNLMGLGLKLNNAAESHDMNQAILDFQEDMQHAVLQFVPDEGHWGIKSPTIHDGVEILLHYMPNCHVICVFRNLVEHAKSFQMFRLKNDGVKTPLTELMREIAQHNLTITQRAERFVQQGIPVTFTTYKGLKSDPWEEAQRIAEFLGITTNDEMRQKVLEFVDPLLHTWKDEGLETIPVEIEI